jgi:hypothetical protein
VEFELTSVVIDNVLTTRVSTKLGFINKVLIMLEDLSKYASLVLSYVFARSRGKFHFRQFYNFEPAGSWVNLSQAHDVNFCSVFATEHVRSD